MSSDTIKIFYCKVCGKDNSEAEFYDYLTSRCKICKNKNSKDNYLLKRKNERGTKLQVLDPDGKTRELWELLMNEPFWRDGKISLLQFMQETEDTVTDLQLISPDEKISGLREELVKISKRFIVTDSNVLENDKRLVSLELKFNDLNRKVFEMETLTNNRLSQIESKLDKLTNLIQSNIKQ